MRLSEWIYQPRHVNPRIQAVGPAIIGNVSQKAANNLQAGVLAGIGFPIVLVISVLYIRRKYR